MTEPTKYNAVDVPDSVHRSLLPFRLVPEFQRAEGALLPLVVRLGKGLDEGLRRTVHERPDEAHRSFLPFTLSYGPKSTMCETMLSEALQRHSESFQPKTNLNPLAVGAITLMATGGLSLLQKSVSKPKHPKMDMPNPSTL